jgi:hypothetical protein
VLPGQQTARVVELQLAARDGSDLRSDRGIGQAVDAIARPFPQSDHRIVDGPAGSRPRVGGGGELLGGHRGCYSMRLSSRSSRRSARGCRDSPHIRSLYEHCQRNSTAVVADLAQLTSTVKGAIHVRVVGACVAEDRRGTGLDVQAASRGERCEVRRDQCARRRDRAAHRSTRSSRIGKCSSRARRSIRTQAARRTGEGSARHA